MRALWVLLDESYLPDAARGDIATREIVQVARCQSHKYTGGGRPFCHRRGVLHIQCEVYNRSPKARCKIYV